MSEFGRVDYTLAGLAESDLTADPMDLFTHVYAEQTAQLREQAAQLRAELEAEGESR